MGLLGTLRKMLGEAQAGHVCQVQSWQEEGEEAEGAVRGLVWGEGRARRIFQDSIMKVLALSFLSFLGFSKNDRIRTPALGHPSMGGQREQKPARSRQAVADSRLNGFCMNFRDTWP